MINFFDILDSRFLILTLIFFFGFAFTKIDHELIKIRECKKKNFYYGQKVKSYDSFFNAKELKVIKSHYQAVTVKVVEDSQGPEFTIPCSEVEDLSTYQEEKI